MRKKKKKLIERKGKKYYYEMKDWGYRRKRDRGIFTILAI